MPFIGWIGGIISSVAFAFIDFILRRGAINITLIAVIVTLLAAAVNTLLNVFSTAVVDVLAAMPEFGFVPYFMPTNIVGCLTAYLTVKLAGTVYIMSVRFIETKSLMLKQ